MMGSNTNTEVVQPSVHTSSRWPCPPLPLPTNLLQFNHHNNNNNHNNNNSNPKNASQQLHPAPWLEVLSCYQHHANVQSLAVSLSALIFALGTLAATLLYTWRRQRIHQKSKAKANTTTKRHGKRQPLKRSVSFTSSLMAAKVIPEHVNFPDPVINAVILFDTCPTAKDVLELAVLKMLDYERLCRIPRVNPNNQLSFHSGSYDPSNLVRTFQVHDEDDSELYKLIQDHIHDPLDDPKGRGQLPWWEILLIEVC
jgi:hypothetical protein